MGTMLVVLLLLIIVIIIAALLVKCCKPGTFFRKKADGFRAKFFWNGAIRYVLQSYLKTAMGATAALVLINWDGGSNIANSTQAVIMIVILAQFPFFFMCVMENNKEQLHKKDMKKKIETLYLGIEIDYWYQRAYSSVFLSRRMLYAVLTVVCRDNPNILIHVFLLSNMVYIVYLGFAEPNDEKLAKRMEFMNESGLQFITYHLALFPLALTMEDEELLGLSMLGSVGLIFVINLIVMVTLSIKGLKRKMYLKGLKKKA